MSTEEGKGGGGDGPCLRASWALTVTRGPVQPGTVTTSWPPEWSSSLCSYRKSSQCRGEQVGRERKQQGEVHPKDGKGRKRGVSAGQKGPILLPGLIPDRSAPPRGRRG